MNNNSSFNGNHRRPGDRIPKEPSGMRASSGLREPPRSKMPSEHGVRGNGEARHGAPAPTPVRIGSKAPLSDEQKKRDLMRRAEIRRRRTADRRSIIIVGAVFAVIAVLNLFQFNRPTESEVEKRKLAEFPSFTLSSFLSGDFTEGINRFFADTFLFRDTIVSVSKKMDSLRGYEFSLDGNGSFVVLDPGTSKDEGDSSLGNILDSLGKDTEDTGSDTGPADDPADSLKSSIVLNKSSMTMTVGGGALLTAELYNTSGEPGWSVSDESVVELTVEDGQAKLKAKAQGEATVYCKVNMLSAECKVKVEGVASGGVDNGDTADFMTNGLFIYGDAVYTKGWYLEDNAKDYGRTLAYYKTLFPNARVSACVIPTSAIRIDNEDIKSKLPDQEEIFDRLDELIGSQVSFVNPYAELYAHRDEYIYFKSDHHWTQRGAYYAYKAFVESVGLEAAPLDSFDIKTLTDSYSGSMYEYTQSEKVKEFKDTVEAFMSRKKMTMTVTDRSGAVSVYDTAIMEWSKSYSAFLCGDNPYTVINVPENPQDRNILVIKDSYGNAFVPFLAENYGNIMVVDTRYTTMNVKETFANYELTDILFVNNLEAANSPAWAKMYLRAAGVAVD